MTKFLTAAFMLVLAGCVMDNGYYDNYGHYHYYDINHTKGNEDNKWDGTHHDDWRHDDNHDWHNPGTRRDVNYEPHDRDYDRDHDRDDD